MPLLIESVSTAQLKPFTRALMDDPRTLWQIEERTGFCWKGHEKDYLIFQLIFDVVMASAEDDDQTFLNKFLPVIEKTLRASNIFEYLDSDEIVVTNGHNGTTPYQHTVKVIKTLDTSTVLPRDRVLLRLEAIYHDVGKAVGAGIPTIDLWPLMIEYENRRHSYPDHEEISALTMMELLKHPRIRAQLDEVDESASSDLVKLILSHHLDEKLQKIMHPAGKSKWQAWLEWRHHAQNNPDPKWSELVAEVKSYTSEQWRIVLLNFIFARADMGSNPKYHEHWLDKNYMLAELLRLCWDELDIGFKQQALAFLGLPKI